MLKDPAQLPRLRCRLKDLCVNMDLIAAWLLQNRTIERVMILGPDDESITGSIYVKPSKSLLENPAHVSELNVNSRYAPMSWTSILLLMQHFHIVNNKFPQPKNDQDVFDGSKDAYKTLVSTQGLILAVHTYNEDDPWAAVVHDNENRNGSKAEYNKSSQRNHSQKTSHDDEVLNIQRESSTGQKVDLHGQKTNFIENQTQQLNSLPELKKVNSLVFYPELYPDDYPSVLQQYLWPELRYLLIPMKHVNLTQILGLKKTAPKLNYLNIAIHIGDIPEFVWTFDWDSLPWRTGFVFLFYDKPRNFIGRFRLNSGSKTKHISIPQVHFYYAFSVLTQISDSQFYNITLKIDRHPLEQYLDFSYNRLESLGYFQVTLINNMNLGLNFSHNNLQQVDFQKRFHSNASFLNPQLKNNFSPKMLDLSYNNLNDPQVDHNSTFYTSNGSEFLLLPHLQKLYLQHNNFTRLPQYAEYFFSVLAYNRKTIKDLKELQILDMSYNYITEIDPHDLIANDFSPLLRVSFKDNSLTSLPSSIYNASYLTHADFSNNRISFKCIWPNETMNIKSVTKIHASIYLSGNSISDLDLTELDQSQINYLHNVLENFDLHLDGNPLNCSCTTHRMFQYLVSKSQSERNNETTKILPDFSFYESHWKCTIPPMWVGIPLMQIPEYEYNTMCDTVEPCPDNCSCYHSWKLNDTLVANCSHDVEHAVATLPVELPDLTTHLYMSRNSLTSLCSVHTYLNNIAVLDFSFNKINEICPEILIDLGNVMELNLTRNQLKQLPEEIELMTNLTKLDLSNNLLEELPKSIQNMTLLNDVVISGNKFRCNCDTFWMTEWLVNSLAAKVNIKDPYSLVCVAGQGQGKRLINLNQDDVGCLSAHQLLPSPVLKDALIGVSSAFAFTIVLAIVIYRKRGYIKICLYTRFGIHPWDKVDENIEDKEFDAFVSYHSKDWPWVCDILMPQLEEEHGFKLCVHERDFDLGAPIRDNITKAINASRRTIVVLTPEYAGSFWCNVEFLEAKVKAFNDRSNYIIVVLLKDVECKKLDMILKLYLETNTYVCATDKWLWKKMIYVMPKIPIALLQDQQNNEGDTNHQEQQNDGNDKEIGAVGCSNNEGIEDEDVPLLNVTIEGNMLLGNLNNVHRLDDIIEENHNYDALLDGFGGHNDEDDDDDDDVDVAPLNFVIDNISQGPHEDDVTLLQDTGGLEGEDVL